MGVDRIRVESVPTYSQTGKTAPWDRIGTNTLRYRLGPPGWKPSRRSTRLLRCSADRWRAGGSFDCGLMIAECGFFYTEFFLMAVFNPQSQIRNPKSEIPNPKSEIHSPRICEVA